MDNIWQSIRTKIPKQYKNEFERQLIKDNFSRLAIFTVLLFFTECIVYFILETPCHSENAISPFLISNIVLIPIIMFVNTKINTINIYLAKAVQYIYAIAVLLLGMFLALMTQGEIDLIHMYLMAVFGITLMINMMPIESCILIFSAYLGFSFLLPYYQENQEIVFIIRQNTLIFNIFTWLQSRIMISIRLSLFLDKKTIQEKNLKLEELAKRDAMTGLMNHAVSFEILKEEMDHARRRGCPLSLIIADIDNFKEINDNYGHLNGDHVIIKVAETIVDTVESTNIIGRYGGEEYIIIMPDTNLEAARMVAKKIQSEIKSVEFEVNERITLSGGISQFSGESIDELIRTTDEKLYRAKKSGKNRFEI
ncbi:GGDEF domain-containing protein [Petroclostridium sp. X23]|uniref:GGDEF domain-containing protein n=1 Tax=Petroclostridium sp. X23 TaxID=3045146 RepID=UPI0024ADBCF6|nr:GGDEF domain-containing protein [Petroclostridium sp. X23]WHH60212.1 GGDEF domain-containing protein [Petroclostridium sp. X23]